MKTTTNLEKENATGENQLGYHANSPVRVLTASSIIGDKVENNKGEDIGKIKDIMVNIHDGSIEYLVIQFGGFLGMGEKLFAVPFSALRLNPTKKSFLLDVDKKFLENAPGFDQGHWPETNAHYVNVTSHWGDFMGVNTGAGGGL